MSSKTLIFVARWLSVVVGTQYVMIVGVLDFDPSCFLRVVRDRALDMFQSCHKRIASWTEFTVSINFFVMTVGGRWFIWFTAGEIEHADVWSRRLNTS